MSEHSIRRCSVCSLTYNDAEEFAHCARCGGTTSRITSDTENPSLTESRALVSRIHAELADEANEDAKAAEALVLQEVEADERAIRAGGAAINWDADNAWLQYDGDLADWVRGV